MRLSVKALEPRNITQGAQSTFRFKEGIDDDNGNYHTVSFCDGSGISSFSDYNPKFKHHGLILHAKMSDSGASSDVHASVDIAGSELKR